MWRRVAKVIALVSIAAWLPPCGSSVTTVSSDAELQAAVAALVDFGTLAVAANITQSAPLNLTGVVGVTITAASGVGPVSLSGGGALRILYVGQGANVTVSGLTLTNGSAGYGGAIYAEGASTYLSVTNVYFVGNAAFDPDNIEGEGGALFLGLGASASVTNSVFEGNRADGGGAVTVDGAAAALFARCRFEGNAGSYSPGGAVHLKATPSSPARFEDSAFSHNEAVGSTGGALSLASLTQVTVSRSTFVGNAGSYGGGALYLESNSEAFVFGCDFTRNFADSSYGIGAGGVAVVKMHL